MVFWDCCCSKICLFIGSDFNWIIMYYSYLLSKEENNQLFLFSICGRLTCLGFLWILKVKMTTVLELALYPFFKMLVCGIFCTHLTHITPNFFAIFFSDNCENYELKKMKCSRPHLRGLHTFTRSHNSEKISAPICPEIVAHVRAH